MKNKNLNAAKNTKNDEFYTQLIDIEKELKHYKKHFKNKVVYCNCDTSESNFVKYFKTNFIGLGLKELYHTSIQEGIDFRSKESIKILKEADIVITNPPFSLFREYVNQLIEYNKKFLIIGTWHAITYKEIFPLIKANKMWIGINSNRNFSGFIVPSHYPLSGTEARIDENGNRIVSSNNTCWFTNLDNTKRHEKLILYKKYCPEKYPQYDNYDAIEVSKTNNIPMDYDGVMGVPVTFLNKYNPDQFEIVGCNRGVRQDPNGVYGKSSFLNGKETFKRLFIRIKNTKYHSTFR